MHSSTRLHDKKFKSNHLTFSPGGVDGWAQKLIPLIPKQGGGHISRDYFKCKLDDLYKPGIHNISTNVLECRPLLAFKHLCYTVSTPTLNKKHFLLEQSQQVDIQTNGTRQALRETS